MSALPVILTASIVSYAFTVLIMKRSILTEKIARRGYHISCEYSVDPLERLDVAQVMTRDVISIPASLPVHELLTKYFQGSSLLRHQGYPVVTPKAELVGVLTRRNLLEEWVSVPLAQSGEPGQLASPILAYDLIQRDPITAKTWESCKTAAERMAHEGVGRLVVVADDDSNRVVGILTRSDIMKARARQLEEEMIRRRLIKLQASDSSEYDLEHSPT
jgi:CBS domain-containing protein